MLADINYRTHNGILAAAAGIVDLLERFFRNTIDSMARERGFFEGHRPILLSETAEHDAAVMILGSDRKHSQAHILSLSLSLSLSHTHTHTHTHTHIHTHTHTPHIISLTSAHILFLSLSLSLSFSHTHTHTSTRTDRVRGASSASDEKSSEQAQTADFFRWHSGDHDS